MSDPHPLPTAGECDDPTVAEREQIRDQYPEVWTVYDGDCHLTSRCPRLLDLQPQDKSPAVLPGSHLSLCALCVERWRRNGNEPFAKEQALRAGVEK